MASRRRPASPSRRSDSLKPVEPVDTEPKKEASKPPKTFVESIGGPTAVFTFAATAFYVVVYFLDMPLFWPYILMLFQMLFELAFQPKRTMGPVMRAHHLANLVVTIIYLLNPTFSYVIRTGLVVEIATLLRFVQLSVGKRHALLALSSAAAFMFSFFYTRFFGGWRYLADADFLWTHVGRFGEGTYHSDESYEPVLRVGYACLLTIHGCGLFWGGHLWTIFVTTLRNDALLPKLEAVGMLPSLVMAYFVSSPTVLAAQCFLTASSAAFHACDDSRHSLLAGLKFVDIVAIVASMYANVEMAGGGGLPMLVLHLTVLVYAILSVTSWTSHPNGPYVANLLGPLSLLNCAVCAPAEQLAVLATPWLLTASVIVHLRKANLQHYIALSLHCFNAWCVYNCAWSAALHAASPGRRNVFQLAAAAATPFLTR